MNILIIENEIYLNHKISTALLNNGNICTQKEKIEDFNETYDAILLSTSFEHETIYNFIKKYSKNSIIILLTTYISNQTVNKPLELGACDYVLKPFLMDDLLRKIYHFKNYEILKNKLSILEEYTKFYLRKIETNICLTANFPILIESNSQKHCDKLMLELANGLQKNINFIDLEDSNWKKLLQTYNEENLIYLINYHKLKKSEKKFLQKIINNKKIIISSLETENEGIFNIVKIIDKNIKFQDNSSIMPISDYIKSVILTYQNKYPDTELSKKLGISRKSLWEKRKKFGIGKK